MGRFVDPFRDPDAVRELVARHGDMAEHHLGLYLHQHRPGEAENALWVRDDGTGALAQKGAEWNVVAEPLAPVHDRPALLLELADLAFREGAASFQFEGRNEFNAAVRARAPSAWSFEHVRPYHWPVFQMDAWDAALPGKDYRDVRNKLNRFRRDHSHRIVPATDVPADDLVALLDRWIGARERPEGVNRLYYESWIRDGFDGFDATRVVLVDETPASLTCGWAVPNSERDYYSAWGIYDYKYAGVGEFANWDDLVSLKSQGWRTVDFGGSDATLLAFKRKFGPTHVYETHAWRIRPA